MKHVSDCKVAGYHNTHKHNSDLPPSVFRLVSFLELFVSILNFADWDNLDNFFIFLWCILSSILEIHLNEYLVVLPFRIIFLNIDLYIIYSNINRAAVDVTSYFLICLFLVIFCLLHNLFEITGNFVIVFILGLKFRF